MPTRYSAQDAANTAVRAFLTEIAKGYSKGQIYNRASRSGKAIWDRIFTAFSGECAYCGVKNEREKLTVEHLIMFNWKECGLHLPGNTVPACRRCNKRGKDAGRYHTWEEHLRRICSEHKEKHLVGPRRRKILAHFKHFEYPSISQKEVGVIRDSAKSLYESVTDDVETACKDHRALIMRLSRRVQGSASALKKSV